MSKTFEYRGDLAVTPLAEILATIHRYRVPGIVTVTRDKRMRRLVLDEGLVVHAASNEKDQGLVHHLLRRGSLDAETAKEAEARQARDGLRMGQVLLQMGVLTPELLNGAIAGQIREILLGALDWDRGEVVFEVGARRAADFVPVNIPIPAAVLEGIRRSGDVKRLVNRMGSAATVLEKASGRPPLSLFGESERVFYEAVDGKTPLRELCARGPGNESENARLLYAFFCLGLLRRSRAPAGAKKIQYKTEGGRIG
jgi:hypothetical protein